MTFNILGFDRAAPWLALALVAGYLIGSIPWGVLIARALGLGDLRKIGSGNIGATNVLRTGHKGAAALTLALDAGKGAAAALLFLHWGLLAAQLAGGGAFLGHLFPVWLRFRGGKGVATFLGLMLALHWPTGLLCCATWLATALVFRFSSLAALVAAASAPVWLRLQNQWGLILCAIVLAALIFVRHHANIARLIRGEEPRISFRRKRG